MWWLDFGLQCVAESNQPMISTSKWSNNVLNHRKIHWSPVCNRQYTPLVLPYFEQISFPYPRVHAMHDGRNGISANCPGYMISVWQNSTLLVIGLCRPMFFSLLYRVHNWPRAHFGFFTSKAVVPHRYLAIKLKILISCQDKTCRTAIWSDPF